VVLGPLAPAASSRAKLKKLRYTVPDRRPVVPYDVKRRSASSRAVNKRGAAGLASMLAAWIISCCNDIVPMNSRTNRVPGLLTVP